MRLIFIHGSGGSKESWTFQTDYFSNSEALDLPGHPDGDLIPTIEGYAEWLHGYVESQGYDEVVLAGHSLGGGIIFQYALDYPQKVRGLISVGSGGRLRVHPKFLEGLAKAVENPGMANDMPTTTYDLVDPKLAETLKRRADENGFAATLNDMKACDRFDIMERLGEIKVPTLALCGSDDVMTPPKYSKFLVDNMLNARAAIIPGGTHYAFAEKPDEVNKAIEEFLQEI